MNIINSIATFLKEVRLESKKVNWLTRQELISYTALVVGFMLVCALFFGLLDFSFSYGLEQLLFNR